MIKQDCLCYQKVTYGLQLTANLSVFHHLRATKSTLLYFVSAVGSILITISIRNCITSVSRQHSSQDLRNYPRHRWIEIEKKNFPPPANEKKVSSSIVSAVCLTNWSGESNLMWQLWKRLMLIKNFSGPPAGFRWCCHRYFLPELKLAPKRILKK